MHILRGKVLKRAVDRWGQGNSCSYSERKATWFKEQKKVWEHREGNVYKENHSWVNVF